MKILFICEGNVFRSQMAEAFFKHYANGALDVEVESAGTHVSEKWEGHRASERFMDAIEAMQKLGIDMSEQRMNKLTPEMVEAADRVILVGDIVAGAPQFLLDSPKLEEWHVKDPGYGQTSIIDARDEIQDRVEALAASLSG